MPAQLTTGSIEGSLLLELLHYAGWRVQIRRQGSVSIHAVRDGVEVRASGRSLSEATGAIFAHAMRSGRRLAANAPEGG
jgi:hypothetical protein